MKSMDATQFLRDVAAHQMDILRDDGAYRHLKFRNAPPHSWNMWFELVTWPNCLTIHGDMGTWSFSRVEDMFTFFRSVDLKINASYWCEKVTSESRFGGPSRQFCLDKFKSRVVSTLDGCGMEEDRCADILQSLDDEVFNGEEDESFVRRSLAGFEHEGFSFSDTWEIDARDYTYHFLWCLYAIVWGIQQYDTLKANGTTEPSTEAVAK